MSRSTTLDTDKIITAEVPSKIADAVMRIGSAIGVRMPLVNEPVAAAAQELYVAKLIESNAKGRAEKARKSLDKLLKVPNSKGAHIVHDSSTAIVTVDNRSPPRLLNEPTLLSMLIAKQGMSVEDAQAFIDSCKVSKAGFVEYLTVVLK